MAGVFDAKLIYADDGSIEFDCYLDNVSLDQAIEGLIVLAQHVTADAAEHSLPVPKVAALSMN